MTKTFECSGKCGKTTTLTFNPQLVGGGPWTCAECVKKKRCRCGAELTAQEIATYKYRCEDCFVSNYTNTEHVVTKTQTHTVATQTIETDSERWLRISQGLSLRG